MQQIGGEPAIGKRRAVGAPDDHGASLAQIVDDRAVAARNHVALQSKTVGGRKPLLIDIGLHGDRHAGQRTHFLVARDRRINSVSLGHHVLCAMVDHGIDGGVDGVEPGQCRGRRLLRRNFFRCYQRSDFSGRQAPEIVHGKLRLIGGVVAPCPRKRHGERPACGSAQRRRAR